MSDWIKVDYTKANVKNVEQEGGVTTITSLSPYDVPIAVRANPGIEPKSVSIEFRYLDDEPYRRERKPGGLILRLGKHSDRLLGIDIPARVVEKNGSEINVLIQDAVKTDIVSQPARSSIIDENHRIAADVIRNEPGLLKVG